MAFIRDLCSEVIFQSGSLFLDGNSLSGRTSATLLQQLENRLRRMEPFESDPFPPVPMEESHESGERRPFVGPGSHDVLERLREKHHQAQNESESPWAESTSLRGHGCADKSVSSWSGVPNIDFRMPSAHLSTNFTRSRYLAELRRLQKGSGNQALWGASPPPAQSKEGSASGLRAGRFTIKPLSSSDIWTGGHVQDDQPSSPKGFGVQLRLFSASSTSRPSLEISGEGTGEESVQSHPETGGASSSDATQLKNLASKLSPTAVDPHVQQLHRFRKFHRPAAGAMSPRGMTSFTPATLQLGDSVAVNTKALPLVGFRPTPSKNVDRLKRGKQKAKEASDRCSLGKPLEEF